MQVLKNKDLQMIEVVLILQLRIEQEHQKVVVSFHLAQVEVDQVTNGKDNRSIYKT